ncbi:YhcN/YlaJ family sporulation lipoprotein [Bacillus tianshenii]|nr:YhcN/YlaJ family sporulation lipoprotein [Bacillus tianshenii]
MYKSLAAFGLCGAILLSGCQADNEAGQGPYDRNGNTLNVTETEEQYNRQMGGPDTMAKNFGFVRHQKSPVPGKTIDNDDLPILNREQVANMISKMSVGIPNVNDCATLVTDEEVLIAYNSDTKNRFETADQVKKTALSVVPRYYHVYVSDDPKMLNDIERYSQMNVATKNVENEIDGVIKEMLKSPQGRKLSTGENENGEMQGEVNEQMDKDMGEKMNNKQNMMNR